MKTNKTSGSQLNLKLILKISFIVVVIIACSSCGRNNNIDATITKISPPPIPPKLEKGDSVLQYADKIPLLPGNDILLMNYIAKNIIYPKSAAEKGIQGTVVVKISISSRGNVTNHEIITSVSPDLDAEALRVLKTLTKFEPAWNEGKPVSASYQIPIKFNLK